MNHKELKEQAEREVRLRYDAWADFSGAEREAHVAREMLRILEEGDKKSFRSKLMVARGVYETEAWSWDGSESFPLWLCEIGGRYQNADGTPSGTAYDLANYVGQVWTALEKVNINPVEIALQGWSKARLMIATIRESTTLLLPDGSEASEQQKGELVIHDREAIREVAKLAADDTVSNQEMRTRVCKQRIPPFHAKARLRGDGSWYVEAVMSNKQYNLISRLLSRYMEVTLE